MRSNGEARRAGKENEKIGANLPLSSGAVRANSAAFLSYRLVKPGDTISEFDPVAEVQ